MIHALVAELGLGWRRALRGPQVALLFVTAGVCLVVLPGFTEGALTRLGYGLGLWWAIALAVALWQGGTAFALDRERHRLMLLFTKPQTAWQRWWGRWVGTLPLLGWLTVVTGVLLFPRALPSGRAVLHPDLPDLNVAAQEMLMRMREAGRVPEGISEGRLLRAVAEGLQNRGTSLTYDTPKSYTFEMAKGKSARGQLTFRLTDAPFFGAKDVLCLTVEMQCGAKSFSQTIDAPAENGIIVHAPEGFCASNESVRVTLTRRDKNEIATVLYRERNAVQLLLPGHSAAVNLGMFLVIFFLTLAMVSALGTTLGALFSLPVALFVGMFALLAMASATLAPGTTVMEEAANPIARLSSILSTWIAMPFVTLVNLNPLYALTEGEAIDWDALVHFFGQTFCIWNLLLSCIGALPSAAGEKTFFQNL